jgi:hypothetical protein
MLKYRLRADTRVIGRLLLWSVTLSIVHCFWRIQSMRLENLSPAGLVKNSRLFVLHRYFRPFLVESRGNATVLACRQSGGLGPYERENVTQTIDRIVICWRRRHLRAAPEVAKRRTRNCGNSGRRAFAVCLRRVSFEAVGRTVESYRRPPFPLGIARFYHRSTSSDQALRHRKYAGHVRGGSLRAIKSQCP